MCRSLTHQVELDAVDIDADPSADTKLQAVRARRHRHSRDDLGAPDAFSRGCDIHVASYATIAGSSAGQAFSDDERNVGRFCC